MKSQVLKRKIAPKVNAMRSKEPIFQIQRYKTHFIVSEIRSTQCVRKVSESNTLVTEFL